MTIQTGANRPDYQQYLSLREAAQLYGYTRDHLGLMIRRGKLQGVRLGNYYATTEAWVDGYIRNYSDADNPKARAKFSNKFRSGVLGKKQPPVIPLVAARHIVKNQKTAVKQESKISDLSELQKHIDEVLAQIAPQVAVAPTEKAPAIKLASAAPAIGATQARSKHEIIILPIRRMRDFERQIIISQAKQQKNTK